jgi:hypothetical protein
VGLLVLVILRSFHQQGFAQLALCHEWMKLPAKAECVHFPMCLYWPRPIGLTQLRAAALREFSGWAHCPGADALQCEPVAYSFIDDAAQLLS